MSHTSVIPLSRPRTAIGAAWTQAEMQELLALFADHARKDPAAFWEVGVTERGDPQFYLASAIYGAEGVCVSRVGARYVALDESGNALADEASLKMLVAGLARGVARTRAGSAFGRCFLALVAMRLAIEQKLEPFLAETTEHFDRLAPGLMALV
jgi:hypothetical protein